MRRALLLAVALLTLSGARAAEPDFARYRLLHAAPEAGVVNVYLDGDQAASVLGYGALQPYLKLAPGVHNFKALVPGKDTVLDDRDTGFEAGSDYTIVLVPLGKAVGFLKLLDRRPDDLDQGWLRAVNLLAGAPAVELRSQGDPALAELKYTQAMRPCPAAGGEATYVFRPPGVVQDVAKVGPLTVAKGTLVTLFLLGKADGNGDQAPRVVTDVQAIPAPETYQSAPAKPKTRLRLLNAVPGQGVLDAELDDVTAVPHLLFGEASEYVPLAAGKHDVRVGPADQPLARRQLALSEGEAYTLVAYDRPAHVALWLLRDEPAAQGAGPAVRVINTVTEFPALDVLLADETKLAAALTPSAATTYQPLPAGDPTRVLRLREPSQGAVLRTVEAGFQAGRNYTLVILGTTDTAATAGAGVGFRLLKDG